MLAGLARWLRVAGYDTVFNPAPSDRELISWADAEHRVLLTRDRHLIEFLQPKAGVLLKQDKPLDQLREVVTKLELKGPRQLFSRCLICNTMLRAASTEDNVTALPEHLDDQTVQICTTCGRLYWHGSHTQRMRAELERALPGWALSERL